ncbi:HD-GYP domain-containing protein [Calidithermus chliarophilus]|uniref:HD-GYP domain-containing protein n=1 Tax=Calidithermus chliarophilus TaxID=52023 RepID=UPI000422DE0C|nr:HD domain-containing phosphohydrolase [Calidithermus chliarophilus]
MLGLVIWGYGSRELGATQTLGLFGFIPLLPWVWRDGQRSLAWLVPLYLGYMGTLFIFRDRALEPDFMPHGVLPSVLALVLLALWRQRELRQQVQMQETLRQMQVLEEGSIDISAAPDTAELVETGVEAVAKLEVAPHIAFVRFREGKPVVISARGDLKRYQGRKLPRQQLSMRATLTDSFSLGSYLEGVPESTKWSSAAVPVSARQGRSLGVLILARDGARPFQSDEKALATSLARVMGAQLGQMEALQQLEAAYDGTLLALGVALEYRDHDTQGHTHRVANWADRLAAQIGIDTRDREYLRWGAYLHDIGKLGVPDRILLKEDQLTPEEWQLMRMHVHIGYEMLCKVPFLPRETLEVVRYHHEAWDGQGYLEGLKGEGIPLLARIFAVVDTFDALSHPRPYKEAWSRERILDELEYQRGRKLDPTLVDTFLDLDPLSELPAEVSDREAPPVQ